LPPPFERMQQAQRHDFAGPQGVVRMFGEACQLVIDLTEEGRDKIQRYPFSQ